MDIHETPYPVGLSFTAVTSTPTSETPLLLNYVKSDNDITICYNLTLPGGDNTFTTSISSVDKENHGVLMFPNPFEAKDHILTVQLQSGSSEPAQLSIVDVLGRQVFTNSYKMDKGENKLQIDISNLKLDKGVYEVVITKTTGTEVIKLLVN